VNNKLHSLISSTWQGALVGGLAVVGLLLPVDFFVKLDSLLLSLRPLEIIPVYATAWVLYLLLGVIAGGLVAFVASGILILIGKYTPEAGRFLAFLIIALVLARALQRGLFQFAGGFTATGKPLDMDALPSKLIILGFAVWLAWRHATILTRLRGFLKAIAACGACAAGLAILMAALPSDERRQAPLPSAANGVRPPIILITIDTLSANHMSLYGYERETTPALSRMAKESVVFERHHSNSNFTTASISSLLSGARPWLHRAFILGAKPVAAIARHGLLPSIHGARYQTLAVATNRYAAADLHRSGYWVDRQASGRVDEPEQEFVKWVPFGGDLRFFPTIESSLNLAKGIIAARDKSNLHYDPESAFSEARKLLLDSRSGAPAFLWVHLFPPHDPYATPAPFLRTFDSRPKALTRTASRPTFEFRAGRNPNFPGVMLGRYDEAIRYVDHHVGQFLDWLKQQGRFDEAMIIVTADHGESFTHGFGGHYGPLLHEELIRVPLLVKLPHQKEGRRINDLLTEHADLLPTVLEYLGQPIPKYVEGRSLKTVLDGGSLAPSPVYSMAFQQNGLFTALQTGTVAMLEGQYKYIRYLGEIKYEFMPKLEDGLYDLSADPGELRNLAGEMPDRAAKMRAAIDAKVTAHSLPPAATD